MDQLSSCYFCGAALDASLDEYPVVPKALHPTTDDQKTVVLCQGCRQKLGTVVETIVAVVENPESPQTTDDSARPPAESASGAAGVDEGWGGAGEPSSSDAGGPSTSDAGGQSDVGEPPATGEADASADDDADDARDADDGSESVTYTTSTAAGGRKSVSGNPESIRDEGRGGRGGENASANGGETASGGADADEEADADGGPADDDGPSMTALENTKVMRLLQNREFPVDREEIRTVALNAYDMSESQFDAVVDAAVDRGLIGEESGRFVEAE